MDFARIVMKPLQNMNKKTRIEQADKDVNQARIVVLVKKKDKEKCETLIKIHGINLAHIFEQAT